MGEQVVNLIQKCSKIIKVKQMSNNHHLISEIDRAEDLISQGRKKEKVFYDICGTIKNGLPDNSDSSRPPIDELGDTLTEKLKNLNQANLKTGNRIVDKLYGKKSGFKCQWLKDINSFRRAVLSSSDSGAKDYLNLTLKVTKIILKNNKFTK